MRTLAEIIAFNEANAELEMPHFGQERMIASEARGPLTDEAYLNAKRDDPARQPGGRD